MHQAAVGDGQGSQDCAQHTHHQKVEGGPLVDVRTIQKFLFSELFDVTKKNLGGSKQPVFWYNL